MDASQLIFEGLKTLEYRGYDSWGIAVRNEKGELRVEKEIGKLPDKIPNSHFSSLNSHLGIGHTRWATHGGVTIPNAHPHRDCTKKLAVIHNGIVENFQELKDELLKKDHLFVSETDTEVIAHLLEENQKAHTSFIEALKQAFNRLSGLNAIVALDTTTNEIVAAKNGSPLLVGISDTPGEYFLASDATGIVKHTKKVIFLEDNQMVSLGKTLKLFSLPKGKELKPKIHKLTWNFTDADKGTYPHFFLKEMHEQPNVIENIALTYSKPTKDLAALIKNAFGTFMLGCGTASYAALAGTYLFSNIAKKHVNFAIGSEFKYLEDYITKRTLVIPISQSGETIDVVEPIQHAKTKGANIAALVNVLGSTLYRLADHKILLGAGQEKAVVATKSFIAMISILLLTAYTLINNQKDAQKILLAASEDIKKLLKDSYTKKVQALTKKLKRKEHIYLIGRGLSYATAMEATMKIKETACVHAEGFAGGELKHGVIALIEKGTPCIVFAPNDETYDEIVSNAQEIKARGGFIIGVGPKNNAVFDSFFETGDNKEATLLSQIVVAQLLAYYLAIARGIEDPDKPRNLAKSVTVK